MWDPVCVCGMYVCVCAVSVVLELEPGVLWMLGKHFTTELRPSPRLCVGTLVLICMHVEVRGPTLGIFPLTRTWCLLTG